MKFGLTRCAVAGMVLFAVFLAVPSIATAMSLKGFFRSYPYSLGFLVSISVVNFVIAYAISFSLFSSRKNMESEVYREMFPLTCRWVGWLSAIALTAVIMSLVLSINAIIATFDSGKSYFPTRVNLALYFLTTIANLGSWLIMHIEGKRADKHLLDSLYHLMKSRGRYN